MWADNQPGQNDSNRIDLHVNFALRQSGEAIGLFAADGTPIDTVVFGPQTNNVSKGRYPDGTANIGFMPGSASPRAANYLRAVNTRAGVGAAAVVDGERGGGVGGDQPGV